VAMTLPASNGGLLILKPFSLDSGGDRSSQAWYHEMFVCHGLDGMGRYS
jgi:hypothetical protein